MKQLEINFIGKGEVKGFIFTQIKKSEKAYIYEVNSNGFLHYEVFKHKENTQFNCISYPKSASFGLWAWSYSNIEKATLKFELLNIESEVKNG